MDRMVRVVEHVEAIGGEGEFEQTSGEIGSGVTHGEEAATGQLESPQDPTHVQDDFPGDDHDRSRNDEDKDGQRPVYSLIKVYEKKGSCEVPECPIMWHVEISDKQSPTEFVYGGFLGLGSMTIVSAQPLKAPGKYELIVSKSTQLGSESIEGYYRFDIDEEGALIHSDERHP